LGIWWYGKDKSSVQRKEIKMLYVGANKCYIDVTKDDYENGADTSPCLCWDFSLSEHMFENLQEFIDTLKKDTGLEIKEDDISFFEGSIRFSVMVNEGNTTPTESQFEKWRQGEETLYIADGLIPACYIPDLPIEMTDEQAKDFGFRIE
jgi:hypothetical protein